MKRQYIRAAEADEDTRLDDAIKALDDEYDYVVAGLEKLGRIDAASRNKGIELATKMLEMLDNIESQIANEI